ncbi:hypothetical protein AAFF_G00310030 [Aldrovandia affinis]|uniref:Uncharacterized protein n=1 Tax=Aldrovandia affinis TaxID=143900 RepID=A0AAD7SP03_9TELE|nr:hypothetical protein AAFF_G00310030 [Aldrovandia affinis]
MHHSGSGREKTLSHQPAPVKVRRRSPSQPSREEVARSVGTRPCLRAPGEALPVRAAAGSAGSGRTGVRVSGATCPSFPESRSLSTGHPAEGRRRRGLNKLLKPEQREAVCSNAEHRNLPGRRRGTRPAETGEQVACGASRRGV